jgi:VanZ family protein
MLDNGPPLWRNRVYRYAPLVVWVGLIFFFSSGAASTTQTSRIIRPILMFLFPTASEETLLGYHFFIRKCAHFIEYAMLAFWTVRALANSSVKLLREYRFAAAVLSVLAIATLDEFNQSFEPTRTSTIWDVTLDVAGGAAMAILLKARNVWSRVAGRARTIG